MTISVVEGVKQIIKSKEGSFVPWIVTVGGVPWEVFFVGPSKKATVTKAEEMQRRFPHRRVRVVQFTPKHAGRNWAVITRTKKGS